MNDVRKYAELVREIDAFRRWSKVLPLRMILSPKLLVRSLWKLPQALNKFDYLLLNQPVVFLPMAAALAERTHSITTRRAAAAWATEYPFESMGRSLRARYPELDFAIIRRIHHLQLQQLDRLNVLKILSGALAVALLLLAQVPREMVELFGGEYAIYRIAVTSITAVGGGVLLLFLLPIWLIQAQTRSRAAIIGIILEYADLQQPGGDEKPSAC